MNGKDRHAATVLLTITLLAWATDECRAQIFESHDSAGVTISVTGPQALEQGRWTISPEPLFRIGLVDGPAPYLFTHVWDALMTSDGRIVVVDRRALDVRVFSSGGSHETTFGGRGGGPLEFGGPPWIAYAAPDTLVVWDPGHFRLSRYSMSGELLDQTTILGRLDSLGIRPFPNGLVWQAGGDGTLVWNGRERGSMMREGLRHWRNKLLRIDVDQDRTTDLGRLRTDQVYYMTREDGGLSGIGNLLAPYARAALGHKADRIATSDGEIWEVNVLDREGSLQMIWRGLFPRAVVTRSMRAEMRDRSASRAVGLRLTRRQGQEAVDRFTTPDSVPAIGALIWDKSDNLWVGRRTGTIWDVGLYDVLDAQGRWLATLEMPEGVDRILEIGEDYLLATGVDGLGVQTVALYGLDKPLS